MTDGQFRYWGRLDPAALTASVNDYAPAGIGESTLVYLTADGDYSITGLAAEPYSGAGNAANRVARFYNATTNRTFSFPGNDTGSAAANRFAHSGTVSIGRGESIEFTYDRAALLWRMTGRVSSGGTTLPVDDGTAVVKGSLDSTKQGRFEVDTNLSTGTTVALAFPASNGVIATIVGSDTQVLFNDGGGAFAGDAGLTYDKTNDQLSPSHLKVGGVLGLSGDAAVTVSSSPQNDWAPTGLSTAGVLRVNPDTVDVTVTGIAAPSSPYNDGRLLVVHNVGTGGFALIFADESASSSAANRLALSGQFHIRNDECAVFYYDLTSTRWRAVSMGTKTLMGTRIVTDGSLQGFYDQNGNEVIQVAGVASAVNHCAFNNAATGSGPTFQPGTGGDANIDLNVAGRGTGYPKVGQSGKGVGIAGIDTANPSAASEGTTIYRSDLDAEYQYEATRAKWLGPPEVFMFGHSSSDLAASTRLRTVGLGSDTDCAYELPFAYTIVAYSYARADSDSSTFEVMVNASTVALTISSSATRGSATNTDVDLAAGDELWARVGSGAANAMSPRTLVLWLRRKAT